jgi:hypothetical protein
MPDQACETLSLASNAETRERVDARLREQRAVTHVQEEPDAVFV